MADVRAMLAIGLQGQLGLRGHLPWEGATGRAFKDDVARFFQVTRGHVLIAGPRTVATVPPAATADRTVVAIRSADNPEDVIAQFGNRIIYIGGGPAVWRSYAHLIRHWDITRLPYDGPADRWFDVSWLTAAKHSVAIKRAGVHDVRPWRTERSRGGREAAGDQQLDGEWSAGRHAEAEATAETGGEV
jgi:dihydromethanopterin reductase